MVRGKKGNVVTKAVAAACIICLVTGCGYVSGEKVSKFSGINQISSNGEIISESESMSVLGASHETSGVTLAGLSAAFAGRVFRDKMVAFYKSHGIDNGSFDEPVGGSVTDPAGQIRAGSSADSSLEPDIKAESTHVKTKQAAIGYLRNAVREKCPIATYETDDPAVENASYTYESAIAAIALMSEGESEDAYKILDAFAEGINQDRESKKRFRNAYMEGDASTVPGYWNEKAGMWYQDAYQVGTGVKSSAAAACALVLGYQKSGKGKETYLEAASTGMDWVLDNCTDGSLGYTAGFTGWKNTDQYTEFGYKSTADNLWLLAACEMIADAKGQNGTKYKEAAEKCRKFVKENMYSDAAGFFFSGTQEDGITPFASLIVSEVQALAELCIGSDAGIGKIGTCLAKDGGYSYDNAYTDGTWLEGTAIVALAQKKAGKPEEAEKAINAMEKFQLTSGAFPQASIEELKTGEEGRAFNNWPSVGACAWYVLAVNGSDFFELSGE